MESLEDQLMANQTTTYFIQNNTSDSQQSSPKICIVFLPYKTKDTFHSTLSKIKDASSAVDTDLILTTSDIGSCKISTSKGAATQTADVLFYPNQRNYLKTISTGDNCFIYLHNNESHSIDGQNRTLSFDEVVQSLKNKQPANDFYSGLKFYGKVNAVREVFNTGSDGVKTVRYNVTMKGSTELESQIYFNNLLQSPTAAALLDLANISSKWRSQFDAQPSQNCQKVLDFIVETFLGVGPDKRRLANSGGNQRSPNQALAIPTQVATYFNRNNNAHGSVGFTYDDIVVRSFGIQKYPDPSLDEDTDVNAAKFTPDTEESLNGFVNVAASNFSNTTVWGLLQQHSNSTINEMYSTLRTDVNGDIVPHIVIRQKPFTSKFFASQNYSNLPVTNFLELPRWIIAPERAIGSYNIGTSDAVRFNFIQVFGKSPTFANPDATTYNQLVAGNYAIDDLDIIRTGGRFGTFTSNADIIGQGNNQNNLVKNIQTWTALVSDWYINGHLKLNGSITTSGIVEPICIGDNLEYQGILFHIEGVDHTYSCDENGGNKSFSTSLMLSNGILTDGNYVHTETAQHIKDNTKPGVLPGINGEDNNTSQQADVKTDNGVTSDLTNPISGVPGFIKQFVKA